MISETKRPLFIVGCDRSGTTLLRLMLTQSEDLHILKETKFLALLGFRKYLYGNFSSPSKRLRFIKDLGQTPATSRTSAFSAFEIAENEALQAIALKAPLNFIGAVRSLYELSALKNGKLRWGDKTPYYVTKIGWLAKNFKDAQFLHIIRDGRDVANSIVKAGWSRSDYKKAARFWVERVSEGLINGRKLGHERYKEVRYEDLTLNPETVLRDICNWMDLRYSDTMLEYYKNADRFIAKEHKDLFELAGKPLQKERVYAWRNELKKDQIGEIEKIAGRFLEYLDYEIYDPAILNKSFSTDKLLWRIKRSTKS